MGISKYIMEKIVGTRNQRVLKGLCPIVAEVRTKESEVRHLPDAAFPEKINELKAMVADGSSLDEILPITFALVREAAFLALDGIQARLEQRAPGSLALVDATDGGALTLAEAPGGLAVTEDAGELAMTDDGPADPPPAEG